MRNFILAVAMLVISVPTFAQTAPDYNDKSKWKYIECDNQDSEVEGGLIAWHQDFVPADSNGINDPDSVVMVMYRPLRDDFIKNEGEDKFKEESKKRPWLLIYYKSSESQLFEFRGANVWRYMNSFKSEEELSEHLKDIYKLAF